MATTDWWWALSTLAILLASRQSFVRGNVLTSPRENDVLVLDARTLDSALKETGLLMVEFYAPWCGHCKQLEPEYAKAATDLARSGLFLGKVDCDANEQLCEEDRWDIEGFPTIKVIRGTTIHDYEGARVAEDIAAFMREVSTFDTLTDDDTEGFEEEDGVFVLGAHNLDTVARELLLIMIHFTSPSCVECQAIAEELVKAAEELYEYYIPVAKVDCDAHGALCKEPRWAMKSLPTLKVYRDGEIFTYYERPVTASGVVQFMKDLAGIDENYTEDADENGEDEDLDDDEDDEDGGVDDNEEVDETNVMSLDSSNIEQALQRHEVMMLEFFAGWCGNCNRLKPRYARAADELAAEGVTLAKVDCVANERLCADQRWVVEGYPTMYLHRRGRFYQYEGPPETQSIVNFVRAAAQPTPKWFETPSELEAFVEAKEVLVVGFFKRSKGSSYQHFAAMAEEDVKLQYGASFDPEVRRINGAESQDKVVVFKKFDEGRVELVVEAETSREDITSFVESASRRLVFQLGTREASRAVNKKDGAVMFVFTEDDQSDAGEDSRATKDLLAMVTALARERENPVAAYVHVARNEQGEGVMEFMFGDKENVEGSLPTVGLVNPPKFHGDVPEKFLFKGDVTLEGVRDFERQFFAGELTPHMRSQVPVLADTRGPVTAVKGQTFHKLVMDNDDDVLVEFYAPWCGVCQNLEPTYRELAIRVVDRPRLIVAKMDATTNDIDHPKVVVRQYPTILFFRGDDKESPRLFGGTTDMESLMTFVDEHAYHASSRGSGDHSGDAGRYTEL